MYSDVRVWKAAITFWYDRERLEKTKQNVLCQLRQTTEAVCVTLMICIIIFVESKYPTKNARKDLGLSQNCYTAEVTENFVEDHFLGIVINLMKVWLNYCFPTRSCYILKYQNRKESIFTKLSGNDKFIGTTRSETLEKKIKIWWYLLGKIFLDQKCLWFLTILSQVSWHRFKSVTWVKNRRNEGLCWEWCLDTLQQTWNRQISAWGRKMAKDKFMNLDLDEDDASR